MSTLGDITDPTQKINVWEPKHFCNKPTVFYWAVTAQRDRKFVGAVSACIYKGWFRRHDLNTFLHIRSKSPQMVLQQSLVYLRHTGVFAIGQSHSWTKVRRGEDSAAKPIYYQITRYRKLLPLCRAVILFMIHSSMIFRRMTKDIS